MAIQENKFLSVYLDVKEKIKGKVIFQILKLKF